VGEAGPGLEPLSLAFLGDPNSVHFRRWVGFMAERGDRVTLLVGEGKEIRPGLPDTIAIERFTPFTARRFRPWGLLVARRSLRRVLARVRPDVVNAHYLTVHGYHAWVSGFHPYAVTLWGSDVLVTPRTSRLAALVARVTLRAADVIMVNSEHLKKGALELGAPPDRLEMVQWGVDLTMFAPGAPSEQLRARLGLKGRRMVFSPRAIAPLYRHGIVLAAFAGLPPDVALVMSRQGAWPDELARIEEQIAQLGLGDRVVLVPTIDHTEMPDYLRLSDLVVSVPASDSTSVTILESMASGVQIVAAELPSMREWLAELDPSLLVPVDDVAATAAAMAHALARSAADRAAIGTRAREIVAARADQARTLGHVEELYRALAKRLSDRDR
jgi:glycosyltransferase involved in cell wall biosynthesis